MSYHYPPAREQRRRSSSSRIKLRLIIAGVIVLFSVVSYLVTTEVNPVTGEKQRISISREQEIAMGLQSAPAMARQFGGESRNQRAVSTVKEMGARLVNTLYHKLQREGVQMPYPFDFHLLNDRKVVNAFALPGGQVFITEALYSKFTHPGQLAGVLGHEIGHVLERHSAERMSQSNLSQRIAGAAGVAGGDINSARMAQMIGNFVTMSYGRQDELESDRWGVELMVLTGYDPRHMLEVMDILEQASAGGQPPEFLSTHPKPANRKKYLQQIINEMFPEGVSPDLR